MGKSTFLSSSDKITLFVTALVVILAIVWLRNQLVQNPFDKDMYIVRNAYSATSKQGMIELDAGEPVEVVLKKTLKGYKIRIMENGTECYIQDIGILRKATQRDSIVYGNEMRFRDAIRKAIKEEGK